MNRRVFLSSSTAVGAMAAAGTAATSAPAGRQWIELRKYSFATPDKMAGYCAFLAGAAIPAFNRAGVRPVGAFKLLKADNPKLELPGDPNDLYVVLPHDEPERVSALADTLDRDAAYRDAGRPIIEAPRAEPAFQSLDVALLHALEAMPRVETPSSAPARVLQLRIYTNHNEDRALRKEEMFGVGGEIAIFRRVGLKPVLFGRALAGNAVPNVTYMLGFDSIEELQAAWKGFGADPAWKALKIDPRFADTEPRIVNLILRPIDGSQI